MAKTTLFNKVFTNCPKCGSDYSEFEDSEFNDDEAWVKVYCPECNHAWYQVYGFKFSEVHEGE